MKGSSLSILCGVCLMMVACKRTPENSLTKIYLIPHAEAYPAFNGSLTWYGRLRAGDLRRWLQDSGVQRIYFNPFARCEHTADSLRAAKNIDTAYFRWDDSGTSLMQSIATHRDYGKHLLVIALPEEIPGILRALGVHQAPAQFPDTAFDQGFIIQIDHGSTSAVATRYGRPPLLPDTIRVPANYTE
ncbi:histidine phosphatase family protein [Thermoflavifilum thermophilum]|uniref:Histidine phosphatase superfamily (Branch 1) n=1 Tax=Thermoflavifilum thermophilum TaxID=1393122 RepID=A0A1I7NK17_9BACT|nr:histidine phosphatase family protein [Thermoflavifilum thermophilum]SFV35021.1 hypothetical protein SAMN05660895_2139 [Thermoflavifilum thermophilum]